MKIVHISLFKHKENDGTRHNGGVEAFGMYLQRAIPDLKLISWQDFPAHAGYKSLRDYDRARVMGDWLVGRNIVDKETIAIVDGYWGLGLEGKVGRLISVVHGSYFGRMIRSQSHNWGTFVDINQVTEQFRMWEHPQTEIVDVADESAAELFRAGIQKEVTLIRHGIDLDEFKPLEQGSLWMHGATSNRKGLHIIDRINMMEIGLEVRPMDERSGDPALKCRRINQALGWIMPSAHEGNSYLLLEVLACGVPVIVYATGLALEMDNRCGVITDDLSAQNFYRHMKLFDRGRHSPREWMEGHGSFSSFAEQWRRYLGN